MDRWLTVDPSPPPPPTKIQKRWNPFDRDDPNLEINLDMGEHELPLTDEWNIDVEYTHKSMLKYLTLLTVIEEGGGGASLPRRFLF